MSLETWVWIDPDGNEMPIDVMRGKKGVYSPVYASKILGLPDGSGGYFDRSIVNARNVDLPVAVQGTSGSDLSSNMRSLSRALNARNGTGRLQVTRDGATRYLNCRYSGGLDNAEVINSLARKSVLTFAAADPYWYGATQEIDQAQQTGANVGFFPLFPLQLIASQVFADITIANNGDVEAWPVWTISGPGDTLEMTNQRTGLTLGLDLDLAVDEYVVIDSRPLVKTILDDAGNNMYPMLRTGQKYLWSLLPGDNNVSINLNGATGDSLVHVEFTERHVSY
jgi:phage-related protein